MTTVGAVLVTALLATAATLTAATLTAPAAQASCAMPAQESPNAFTGTVVSTDREGRVAEVVRDDGTRVVVEGTPTDGGATSVDRRYVEGGRYEFHPVNDTSPFQDNACTATRQISGPAPPAVDPQDAGTGDRLPGWLAVDEQAGPVGYAAVAGLLLLAAAGVTALVRAWRRGQPAAAAFMSRRSSGGRANSSDSSADTTSSTSP